MKNEIVKLPEELNDLAIKVPESKQNEVKKVLTDIFTGTADWEAQIDAIKIKDISDTMSIQLADTARKNAKNARLGAEKIFDEKRNSVQLRMIDDKLEDALWLKSKQIMQLKFKHIEEKAKFKSEFVKRHEAEQLQLRNDLRYQKVLKYIPDEEISILEIGQMSDNVFEAYLSGIKKEYDDRIAAEKKAEEERIAKEKAEAEERKRIAEENEKLKKEAEERERLAKIESEKREKAEEERKTKEEAERKTREEKERKERAEYEAKLKAEREAKEKIEREEKVKREKLEAELKAKEEAERKTKEEEVARLQTELNKGDAAKVIDLLSDLESLKFKYVFKSAKNKEMYSDTCILIDKVINHINK